VIGTMRGAPVKATCDKVRALTDYAAQKKETPFAALREAVKGESLDPITRASDDLQRASHAMAEQLYKQSEANAANAAASAHKNGDTVKDGEVVDA